MREAGREGGRREGRREGRTREKRVKREGICDMYLREKSERD